VLGHAGDGSFRKGDARTKRLAGASYCVMRIA
jgi:hypothetical protein